MMRWIITGSVAHSAISFGRVIDRAWRGRPGLRRVTLAAGLGIYALLSLEPFDWQLPRNQANHAERVPEGWRFAASGIVVAELPDRWLETAQSAGSIGVSVVVRPRSTVQSGPARILTISRDTHLRNLTLGQDDDDLVVRLRTERTDRNGLRAGQPIARVEDVFRAGSWVAIDLQIRPRQLAITIDGERTMLVDLPESVLASWQPALTLALGNETTCDRPWLGEIRQAVIEVPGAAIDLARRDNVDLPGTCWVIGYPPAILPFRLVFPQDVALNVLMYLPLGCLFGLAIRPRSYRALAGSLLVILAVSAAFEGAQLFVASRFASVDDVICNTIGGGIGLGLAYWLSRRPRAPRRA